MDRKQIIKLIDRFASERSEITMQKLIDMTKRQTISDEDIAYLVKKLAMSGDLITIPSDITAADIASTGGPSSLSTLLCPLYLRKYGYWIPKLTVPGRPAGGIDVLAQIPCYKFILDKKQVIKVLNDCGYAHFLSSETITPLDVEFYKYRRKIDSLSIPILVIASILAKKLAVGISRAGLDVRVASHGNFGVNWEEARYNAKHFCSIAAILDIKAKCFLTDASVPYQPFIGRGESLIALSMLFENRECSKLTEHDKICYSISKALADKNHSIRPKRGELKSYFEQNLVAQGSSYDFFKQRVEIIKKRHSHEIRALNPGYVNIDLELLRYIIVSIQNDLKTKNNTFPDPCGIILKRNTCDYVEKGDLLATVRAEKEIWNTIIYTLKKAITTADELAFPSKFEEVSNA